MRISSPTHPRRWSRASARSATRLRRARPRSSRRWNGSREPRDGHARMTSPSPPQLPDGWTTSAPEAVGLDGSRLGAVLDWLDHLPNANLHSLLVARCGALAFEHYRKGTDERSRDLLPDAQHGVAVKHDLRSATKSVTGLLAGIALERKQLPGLDARVLDYFAEYPDLRTPEKVRITVRHLLTMSAGPDWDEDVALRDPAPGQ